jgi:hypothetical protein
MYETYSVIFLRWLNIVRSVGETHAVVITFFAFAPVSLPLNRYEKVEVDMSKMSKLGLFECSGNDTGPAADLPPIRRAYFASLSHM